MDSDGLNEKRGVIGRKVAIGLKEKEKKDPWKARTRELQGSQLQKCINISLGDYSPMTYTQIPDWENLTDLYCGLHASFSGWGVGAWDSESHRSHRE